MFLFLYHAAPSAPPDNITAISLTSSQILVSWDPPPPEHRNGPILAYNFIVTDTSSSVVIWSSILLNSSTVVGFLKPFTIYNFSISARTSVGYGPIGSTTETTLEDSECLCSDNITTLVFRYILSL